MNNHDDDLPPHERIARMIETDAGLDPSYLGETPHPAMGGAPSGQGEGMGDFGDDEVDPADAVLPPDAADISRAVLAACAREPQNDVGNGQRLLHHFGADLLNVRNVGWHAWAGSYWEREGGNEIALRHAHATASRIVLEAEVMAPSPNEQRAIDAAAQAREQIAAIDNDQDRTRRVAQKMARVMLQKVVDAGDEALASLGGRKSSRRKYAISSGNAGKIRGMLDHAAPYKTVTVDDLDADPLAFNVQNGTIRFVYSLVPDPDASDHSDKMVKRWRVELTPHRQTDWITKVAPLDYDPKARAPHFMAAVQRFLPIEPVRDFVQRYFGYALTGQTGEQCFVFSYGTGANWKSTFTEIIARIMGPYCATINFESLSGDQQRSGSGPSPDLARLPGARLVRASEPERGVQFKEALIKSLTGGEPMLVRSLNKDFFEFRPTFKLVLSGNHKPEVSGVDHGIWRRIKFVPWPVTIADHERRPMDDVMGEIWPERSGILNWLIAGALDYLNNGLRTPAEVMEATAEYRDEQDPVGNFVGDCVESVPSNPDGTPASSVSAREMYDAFAAWGHHNAVRPWKEKAFGTVMSQKGFSKERKSSGQRYLHVRLKNVPAAPRRRSDDPPHPADDDCSDVVPI